jgi:hypothetical protein
MDYEKENESEMSIVEFLKDKIIFFVLNPEWMSV